MTDKKAVLTILMMLTISNNGETPIELNLLDPVSNSV